MKVTIDLVKPDNEVCYGFYYGRDPVLNELVHSIRHIRYSKSLGRFCVPIESCELKVIIDFLNACYVKVEFGADLLVSMREKRVDNCYNSGEDTDAPLTLKYEAYLRGLRLSDSTIRTYTVFIHNFERFVGGIPLEDVGNEEVRLFVEQQIRQKDYSISTHRQLISAIKHFGTLFLESEIDTSALIRPRKSSYLPLVLSQEEVMDLLRATRNLKHRTALALLYSSGLRIGELIDLELKMINLDRKQIFIQNGKGRKDRMVVMAEGFMVLFRNYYMTYRPKRYFLEGSEGGKYHPGSIRRFLRLSCKRAGITKRVTPHTLRHSYATHLIENGVGLRYVQELLGHAKPETTMIYTHVAQKSLTQIESPLDTAIRSFSDRDNSTLHLPFSDNLFG